MAIDAALGDRSRMIDLHDDRDLLRRTWNGCQSKSGRRRIQTDCSP